MSRLPPEPHVIALHLKVDDVRLGLKRLVGASM
jgi:hypothetical protein